MPYPFTFRPNTTAKVYDQYGDHQNACEMQLFKPLLGCTFNSSVAPPSFVVPSGGLILRGLVKFDSEVIQLQELGPREWAGAAYPRFRLDEDPRSYDWIMLDGLPWLVEDTDYLLSFFACKNSDNANPGGAEVIDPPRIAFEVWEHDTPPPGASVGSLDIGFFVPSTRTDLTGITGAVSYEKLNKSVVVGLVDAGDFFSLLTPAQSTPMFWVRWTDPLGRDWTYVVQWWEWRTGSDSSGTDLMLLMLQTNDTGDFPRGN